MTARLDILLFLELVWFADGHAVLKMLWLLSSVNRWESKDETFN